MESKYDVKPYAGYTFDQILHLLQKNEAQTLFDPDTMKKCVYIPTPGKQPGVKKIADMVPSRERQRTVTYGGCDTQAASSIVKTHAITVTET